MEPPLSRSRIATLTVPRDERMRLGESREIARVTRAPDVSELVGPRLGQEPQPAESCQIREPSMGPERKTRRHSPGRTARHNAWLVASINYQEVGTDERGRRRVESRSREAGALAVTARRKSRQRVVLGGGVAGLRRGGCRSGWSPLDEGGERREAACTDQTRRPDGRFSRRDARVRHPATHGLVRAHLGG